MKSRFVYPLTSLARSTSSSSVVGDVKFEMNAMATSLNAANAYCISHRFCSAL